jgi:hypothetical protein
VAQVLDAPGGLGALGGFECAGERDAGDHAGEVEWRAGEVGQVQAVGDALAYRRGDLDLEAAAVRVRAAFVERSTGELVLGPSKSKAGRRVVGNLRALACGTIGPARGSVTPHCSP